jgi:hypothetical protein
MRGTRQSLKLHRNQKNLLHFHLLRSI